MPAMAWPGRVAFSRSLVLVRNEIADHALLAAASTVCGPAKRSRNRTCVIPERSTTATLTWKPSARHLASAACAAFKAVSGVRERVAKVASSAAAMNGARRASVIPAQAGSQLGPRLRGDDALDPRLRGDDIVVTG